MISIQNTIQGKIGRYSQDYTTLSRGIVVNTNDDKYNIGRVQVRIYNLHGTSGDGIPDDQLPWARPSTLFSTHDGGSYMIPEIGTTVWLLFEDGNINKPVYIGGCYGTGTHEDRELGKTNMNTRKQPKDDAEIPKNIDSENTYVVFKSPTGKSIIIDDNDDIESILIRDHLGQVISFEGKLDKDYKNSYAYKEEYLKDMRDTQFNSWENLKDYAKIILKGVSHSLLSIIANAQSSIVNLKSKLGQSESNIQLSSGEDKEIKLWVNGSNNNITINDDFIKITVGGTSYTFTESGFSSDGDIRSSGSIMDTTGNSSHHSH